MDCVPGGGGEGRAGGRVREEVEGADDFSGEGLDLPSPWLEGDREPEGGDWGEDGVVSPSPASLFSTTWGVASAFSSAISCQNTTPQQQL